MKSLPVAAILLSFLTSCDGAAAQGTAAVSVVSTGNATANSGAPLPATAPVGSSTQMVPLRPAIFAPPSSYEFTPSQATSATIPIGALPPAGSAGSLPSLAPNAVAVPYAANTGTPNAASAGTTDPNHHKGLVDDTVDVGTYIVKAYVWTYIVLPSKIIKETAKILF